VKQGITLEFYLRHASCNPEAFFNHEQGCWCNKPLPEVGGMQDEKNPIGDVKNVAPIENLKSRSKSPI
jgi:hypothetical protein